MCLDMQRQRTVFELLASFIPHAAQVRLDRASTELLFEFVLVLLADPHLLPRRDTGTCQLCLGPHVLATSLHTRQLEVWRAELVSPHLHSSEEAVGAIKQFVHAERMSVAAGYQV